MLMRIYYVWPKFPSVSMSGPYCALRCRHCNRHYLSHMHGAPTPDSLLNLALELERKGARGLLLSGGCDREGRMLNLPKLLPAIKKIKRETDLILKLHTGFVDPELAEGIVEAEVDIASMEFVGADESVREIFGLNVGVKRYVETFVNLSDAGMKYISPHVAVGLHYGHLLGEFNALNLMKEHINPDTVVIIVFRPTKGTELEHLSPPSARDVGRVVAHARKLFPEKKILLGSMRPRSSGRNDAARDARLDIELAALNNGMDAIEIPSPPLLRILKERGYRLKRIEAYGVLPIDYEERLGYEWL